MGEKVTEYEEVKELSSQGVECVLYRTFNLPLE